MIRQWHILISGFTQSIDRENGFDRLWKKLRPLVSEHVSLLPPQQWKADFSAIAEFIYRMKPENTVPDIRVYAYSWGCGYGFLELAKQLNKHKLGISEAVLCDPVYYSRWRPWRAIARGRWALPIKIPTNVTRVHWFRQFENRPQATELIGDVNYTLVTKPVILKVKHAYMEDQIEFHTKCLEVARL